MSDSLMRKHPMCERFMCDRPMCGHPMTERLVCDHPMRDHPMCERPDTTTSYALDTIKTVRNSISFFR